MKEKLFTSLKASIAEEETKLKKKTNSIMKRFAVADNVLDESNTNTVVIRDTFTLPKHDYDLITICRNKFLENKMSVTKSEIIRMGIILVSKLSDIEINNAYKLIEKIKTGRPRSK